MLVLDKPEGPTSHDAVDRARRALGVRRVGHAGTLDPFATGVLPLCVGRATRLASFLTGGTKAYEATLRLGFATTTDDRTGEPLGEPRAVGLGRAQVEAACRAFVGEIDQVPPAYSAKKVGGERLYALARRGKNVERRAARVRVLQLDVDAVEGADVRLRVRCSAGTYIRALARDIGASLGVGGHLIALRRTESAGLGLSAAVTWEELAPENRSRLASKTLSINELLPAMPAVSVSGEGARAARHGRLLKPGQFSAAESLETGAEARVVDEKGALLAIGRVGAQGVHPHLVLVD